MSKIKISIIMPVYNGEKYLRKTLDSVLAQRFEDFELIAVNDGSEDKTLLILYEYQSKISKMRIINQENKGVSIARNRAIKEAIGEYICFLDADDILHPDFLSTLYKVDNEFNSDIVFCNYKVFYRDDCKFDNYINLDIMSIKNTYPEKYFDYMMEIGLGTALWNKLYNKDLIVKNNIYFNPKSTYGEDMFFNWKVCMVANNIIYIKQSLYGYRLSDIAATTKYHPNLFEKYCNEFEELRIFGKNHGQNMKLLNESIYINLAQRIPSFLRMNIRRRASIYSKYRYICELADDKRIKIALDKWYKSEFANSKKSLQYYFIKRKYMLILVKSIYSEIRFKFVRKIKNIR